MDVQRVGDVETPIGWKAHRRIGWETVQPGPECRPTVGDRAVRRDARRHGEAGREDSTGPYCRQHNGTSGNEPAYHMVFSQPFRAWRLNLHLSPPFSTGAHGRPGYICPTWVCHS